MKKLTLENATVKRLKISFYCLHIAAYIAVFIYGIVALKRGLFEESQCFLILLQSAIAILIVFIPLLIEKCSKFRMSFAVTILISVYSVLAIFIGETLQFYYKTTFWDDILHVISGALLLILGYAIVNLCFNREEKLCSRFTMIFFTTCFAIACGVIWELLEFTIDSIFGTNMQKFMPVDNNLFNGGDSFADLNGTTAQIADFFRAPYGYKYALMDTMRDFVADVCGNAIGLVITLFLTRKDKDFFFKILYRDKASAAV